MVTLAYRDIICFRLTS